MVVIHRHCIGIEQSSKTEWNSVGLVGLCMCCFVFCVCCCIKRVGTIHCGVGVRLLFFDSCSFERKGGRKGEREGDEWVNVSVSFFVVDCFLCCCVRGDEKWGVTGSVLLCNVGCVGYISGLMVVGGLGH